MIVSCVDLSGLSSIRFCWIRDIESWKIETEAQIDVNSVNNREFPGLS